MNKHRKVKTGGLQLMDPAKTSGGMADGHDGSIKLRTGIGLQSQGQRTDHGATQERRAGIRAFATVV